MCIFKGNGRPKFAMHFVERSGYKKHSTAKKPRFLAVLSF